MPGVSLQRAASPKYLELWVIKQDGKRIGKIYTHSTDGKVFVSIFLNKPDQGKGLGFEALRLFMKSTKHKELYAQTRKSNRPMRKILQKLAWTPVDAGRQALYTWHK